MGILLKNPLWGRLAEHQLSGGAAPGTADGNTALTADSNHGNHQGTIISAFSLIINHFNMAQHKIAFSFHMGYNRERRTRPERAA